MFRLVVLCNLFRTQRKLMHLWLLGTYVRPFQLEPWWSLRCVRIYTLHISFGTNITVRYTIVIGLVMWFQRSMYSFSSFLCPAYNEFMSIIIAERTSSHMCTRSTQVVRICCSDGPLAWMQQLEFVRSPLPRCRESRGDEGESSRSKTYFRRRRPQVWYLVG